MLSSTKTYRVKISYDKYSGYLVSVQQLCIILWVFKFWDITRGTRCSTITQGAKWVIMMEDIYGPLEIVDTTNSMMA